MRIILYHTSATDTAQADVFALRDLRGYDCVAYYELADPRYNAQGFEANPIYTRQNLAAELIAGAAVVLPYGVYHGLVRQLRTVCEFMDAPILWLEDLPMVVPDGDEEKDLFRAQFRAGQLEVLRKEVGPTHADGGVVTSACAKKEIPNTDIVLPVAEISDAGDVVERSRTPREWMRNLQKRFVRWEERFALKYGQWWKNPVSRKLQEDARAQRARPVPYRLNTHPTTTT